MPSSIFFLKKLKRFAEGDSGMPKLSSHSAASFLPAAVDVYNDTFGDTIVDVTVLGGEYEGDTSKDGDGFVLVVRAAGDGKYIINGVFFSFFLQTYNTRSYRP